MVTKSGIRIPSIHQSSDNQLEIVQSALTGKQSHATNTSTMSRVPKVFDTFRSNASKASSSTRAWEATFGTSPRGGMWSMKRGWVFVVGRAYSCGRRRFSTRTRGWLISPRFPKTPRKSSSVDNGCGRHEQILQRLELSGRSSSATCKGSTEELMSVSSDVGTL